MKKFVKHLVDSTVCSTSKQSPLESVSLYSAEQTLLDFGNSQIGLPNVTGVSVVQGSQTGGKTAVKVILVPFCLPKTGRPGSYQMTCVCSCQRIN